MYSNLKLNINNIGIIKKANVNISNITVIAGENDSGKSTVGKVLMAMIKADNTARHKFISKQSLNFIRNRQKGFDRQVELLFDNEISIDGSIVLKSNNKDIYNVKIEDDKCISFSGIDKKDTRLFLDCTFIQTPLVWDLYNFFVSISTYRTENEIYGYDVNIEYPYILWDLYVKLIKKRRDCDDNQDIIDEIISIISGEFKKNKQGKFYYDKEGKDIPLQNIATGIKSFGIIQVLLQNCYLNEYRLLVLDEPEIHLYPKWQLKFAKIITILANSGVKIIVNTHSPYMVEAIQRYSKLDSVDANFYFAQDGIIEQVEDNNAKTLSKIFAKLSEPFDEFDSMDSENLNGGYLFYISFKFQRL
ncbi:MAG: AAA family ATPase [Candidatus Gracilibacteria bacterium]